MGNKVGTFKKSEDKPDEKNYYRPQLIMYGNIRETTQNVGTMGMNDMGGGNDKTGF